MDILILGAAGFIGNHLARRLKAEGHAVRGVDMCRPHYAPSAADEFMLGDLRDEAFCRSVVDAPFDEVYQLAADMGGAGYIFTGEHDADIMQSSARINLNVLGALRRRPPGRVLFASSACIYPHQNQQDSGHPVTAEASAYPADPDSEYGWEKLFAERCYLTAARNHGLAVRIARLHNVFGPEGAWDNGREKAPAAICRKVAMAPQDGVVEVWGDGEQTRSFLYIDECLDGLHRLMRSDVTQPLNLGSAEMVSINALVELAADIAGKRIVRRHVPGPTGVRGRCSDNTLIRALLGWAPTGELRLGLEQTYRWIEGQLARQLAHA